MSLSRDAARTVCSDCTLKTLEIVMAAVLIRRLPLPSSACPLFRVPPPSSPLCFSVAARHPHQATCYRFNYVSGLSIDKRTRAARSLADFHSNDRLECYFSQFLFSPLFSFFPSLFGRFLFCPFIFNRSSTPLFVSLSVFLPLPFSFSFSVSGRNPRQSLFIPRVICRYRCYPCSRRRPFVCRSRRESRGGSNRDKT